MIKTYMISHVVNSIVIEVRHRMSFTSCNLVSTTMKLVYQSNIIISLLVVQDIFLLILQFEYMLESQIGSMIKRNWSQNVSRENAGIFIDSI